MHMGARPDGTRSVTELHAFPLSRGRVLRYIGEDIERASEFIIEYHLDEIAAFKREREKVGKVFKRASCRDRDEARSG